MRYELHSEGFEVTDAIRESVDTHTEHLSATIPEKTSIQIFLKQESPQIFSATFKCHLWKKDFVIQESGPDLYSLIVSAVKNLSTKIHKLKDKQLSKSRRRHTELLLATEMAET